jgi:hypothetical protein
VAVDHHLLDRVVGEQLLERSEPDRIAQDEVDDLPAPRAREHRGGLVDELADARPQIGRCVPGRRLRAAPLDQPQAQLGGQEAGMVVGGGDVWIRRRVGLSLPSTGR